MNDGLQGSGRETALVCYVACLITKVLVANKVFETVTCEAGVLLGCCDQAWGGCDGLFQDFDVESRPGKEGVPRCIACYTRRGVLDLAP
jgi:hypothetical protein